MEVFDWHMNVWIRPNVDELTKKIDAVIDWKLQSLGDEWKRIAKEKGKLEQMQKEVI